MQLIAPSRDLLPITTLIISAHTYYGFAVANWHIHAVMVVGSRFNSVKRKLRIFLNSKIPSLKSGPSGLDSTTAMC